MKQLLSNEAETTERAQEDRQEVLDESSVESQAVQALPESENISNRDTEEVPVPTEAETTELREAASAEVGYQEKLEQQLSLENVLLKAEPLTETPEQEKGEPVLIIHPLYGGEDTAYSISDDAKTGEPSLKRIDELPALSTEKSSDTEVKIEPAVQQEEPASPTVPPAKEETRPPAAKPYVVITDSPEVQPVKITVEPAALPTVTPDQKLNPYKVMAEPPAIQASSIPDVLAHQEYKSSLTPPAYAPPAKSTINQPVDSINRKPSIVAPDKSERMTAMAHPEVEKAMRAALYIEAPMIFNELEKLLEEQSGQPAVSMKESLKTEVDQTRRLARLKFQNELAGEIVPLARQLIHNAESAGLVQNKGGIKTLPGKHYTVQYLKTQQAEKIKVQCRQGKGYIYAVNGKVKETKGLQVKDRDRFIGFAQKSPQQLRQMVKPKKAINSEMSQ